ncbi:hypothetical protein GV829_04640 [Sphingomonas lacunae]|uniref:Uncharacterized protein n=1 Tax=Sphingomonas lacunae TaxID=2698828 RepID=A0A6M4AS06_9SPHN|nr:hypothetical protein [Sphingomonas lacunae]QJQ31823.1 hypothetical protein GV829_04640 [Sphingomonas lacunae]
MVDRVAVSNLALSIIGEDDQLVDPLDDTKAARTIAAVWDAVRDEVLRKHPWNFAIRRTMLTAVDGYAPVNDFTHLYTLPPDCLRVLDVAIGGTLTRDYAIEAQGLLSYGPGPVGLRYVSRVENAALWDSCFVRAFACRLAWQISERITGDLNRKAAIDRDYRLALAEAKAVDGRENPPEPAMDSSWITSRITGPSGIGEGSGW